MAGGSSAATSATAVAMLVRSRGALPRASMSAGLARRRDEIAVAGQQGGAGSGAREGDELARARRGPRAGDEIERHRKAVAAVAQRGRGGHYAVDPQRLQRALLGNELREADDADRAGDALE